MFAGDVEQKVSVGDDGEHQSRSIVSQGFASRDVGWATSLSQVSRARLQGMAPSPKLHGPSSCSAIT